jgi:hypothetical protein
MYDRSVAKAEVDAVQLLCESAQLWQAASQEPKYSDRDKDRGRDGVYMLCEFLGLRSILSNKTRIMCI